MYCFNRKEINPSSPVTTIAGAIKKCVCTNNANTINIKTEEKDVFLNKVTTEKFLEIYFSKANISTVHAWNN
jgi:hypothetical protein